MPTGSRDPSSAAGAIPQVVVVGVASRDRASDDPRGWRLGGGVSYSALTTARLGLRTGALIGVDAEASTAGELDLLRAAGVDVRLVKLAHGPVFENIESPGGRIQLCLDRSDLVPAASLPTEWRHAGAWIIAPVAAEVSDEWAAVPPVTALVAAGWQGLLRELTPGEKVRHRAPGPSAIVARADVVGVSRDDFDQAVPLAALCRLMKPSATLCLTQRSRGGLAMIAGAAGPRDMRRWPAIPPDVVVDPTGAGDVFLAAFFAACVEPRLVGGRTARGYDLLLGASAASLVLEDRGLLGVAGAPALRERIARGRRPAGENPSARERGSEGA